LSTTRIDASESKLVRCDNSLSTTERVDNMTMKVQLEAIQNIVGSNGLKSILNYAGLKKYIDTFPPDNDHLEIPLGESVRLNTVIDELFGKRGARTLQIQIGREIIRLALEKRGRLTKALRLTMSMVPEERRMRIILEKWIEQALKRVITNKGDSRFELKDEGDYFLLVDNDNPSTKGVSSDTNMCYMYIGQFQYLLEWATGKHHTVEIIECSATGYPRDVFRIWKTEDVNMDI
jgi:predicted hydrocarbon binding protein